MLERGRVCASELRAAISRDSMLGTYNKNCGIKSVKIEDKKGAKTIHTEHFKQAYVFTKVQLTYYTRFTLVSFRESRSVESR